MNSTPEHTPVSAEIAPPPQKHPNIPGVAGLTQSGIPVRFLP